MLYCISGAIAQTPVTVKGKVSDGETGEALPYVNVIFTGTKIGTLTDFDGFFSITTAGPVDSLTVSYVGYTKLTKAVKPGIQTLNFAIFPNDAILASTVVRPGVNPALRIIKKAQKNKKDYNLDKLESFEYESYSRVQLAVDNISEQFKKRKIFKAMEAMFDTISSLSVDSAIPVLPVFVSETMSDYYFRKLPRRTKEIIHATKVKGVGVGDDSYIAQVLGSTFQQYNFNENNLYILDKDFISPLSIQSISYYVFSLIDSVFLDGRKCFVILVNPKNKRDLVFTGTIWVTDSTFALKQLSLEITKEANLNFIEKMKIQQEMEEVEPGTWIPRKTRVLIDISEVTSNTAGMIGLYYNSNKNFRVNTNRDLKFFEEKIEIDPLAYDFDDRHWDTIRHEKLDSGDVKIYKMVDSLKNQPLVKTYVDFVETMVEGYKSYGPIDYGPYSYIIGGNPLEGFKMRAGFRTNEIFSKDWVLKAYGAYGFGDKKWKYGATVEYVISRKKWTKVGAFIKNDVELLGLTDKDYGTAVLFDNFSTLGSNQLNRAKEFSLCGESEFMKGYIQKLYLNNKTIEYDHYGNFYFRYFDNPENKIQSSSFINTTITLEGRFSYKELYVIRNKKRISMGNFKAPVITISYTHGFKGVFNGQFNYNKFGLLLWQFNSLGNWGTFEYNIRAGKTLGRVPYPLLDVLRGNQSYFSTKGAYNLMNFYEFVTDQYISAHYEHQFNGLLLNRMPLLKKWKWREFVNFKVVYGTLSDKNFKLIPKTDDFGIPVSSIGRFDKRPYAEFGYGIENIFKFLRIDFIHRINYLEHANTNPFGVKGTVVIRF
jgi:hypothetical protein